MALLIVGLLANCTIAATPYGVRRLNLTIAGCYALAILIEAVV